MAGIAGWIAGARSAPGDGDLGAALEALAHRGAGEPEMRALRNRAFIGARGPGPACDEHGGIVAVLDGELCNRDALRAQLAQRGHRFASGSSVEVLLRGYQHWDKEVVRQLRGAFALAVWDAGKERLLLARDRFGEKPLNFAQAGDALFFASEIRALLRNRAVDPAIDLRAVWDCLAYRYVPGPRTLVAGVRKLAPGTYALWQFGKLREVRYWFAPDRDSRPAAAAAREPVAGFIERLDEAVRLRIGGDGAPAAFLSGGFDSAAIVALMARHAARVSTFSAGFADDRASELPAAAALARHFGTAHHEIVLSPREAIEALPRLVAARGAPLARPADIALHLLARETARSVKTVLTGDGGDEILGGYRRHAVERCIGAFGGLLGDWRSRWVRWAGLLDAAARERLSVLRLDGPSFPLGFDADPRASRLRRMLYFEQSRWLADELLERGDRMTMAASLEARAPFVDHRLAEYVSRLPDALRVRRLSTKWVLRRAAGELCPQAPRKGGFRIPVGEWLRGEMRELVLEHLRGAGSLTRCYYDVRVLDRLLDEHLAGRRGHAKVLWTLLNLEIWHRSYRRG